MQFDGIYRFIFPREFLDFSIFPKESFYIYFLLDDFFSFFRDNISNINIVVLYYYSRNCFIVFVDEMIDRLRSEAKTIFSLDHIVIIFKSSRFNNLS